eukprot:747574-Hanusia_phi.AAC.22
MVDEDAGCRRAAVDCIAKIALLNKVASPEVTNEARRLLEQKEGVDAHTRDANPIIQTTVRNALRKIRSGTRTYVDYHRTEEGQYSKILPAKWVKLSQSGGIVSEEVLVMPHDTKFHSSLPYRPPTPPWDPIAQQKQRIQALLYACSRDSTGMHPSLPCRTSMQDELAGQLLVMKEYEACNLYALKENSYSL